MSIDLQKVHDWKAKSFMGGVDSEDFETAFAYAVERTVDTLNSSEVGLTGVECPDDMESDLDVDAGFLGPVTDMIDYFLQETGQWEKQDYNEREIKFKRAKARAHTLSFELSEELARLGDLTEDDEDEETLS